MENNLANSGKITGFARINRWSKNMGAPEVTIIRNLIQVGCGLFLLYTGWKFYLFVRYFETMGATRYTSRPPAVEGFLPISALVSLKSWLGGGGFDRIHPAGLAIFLGIVLISLLFKKGFCSWFCPVGTISEALGRLGEKLFGRNLRLPKFLDYPLMAVKYLILGFFSKVILVDMSALAAQSFQQSPRINVAESGRVWSPECTSCFRCTEVCPTKALAYQGPGRRFTMDPRFYPFFLFGVYLLVVVLAQATGHWQTSLTLADYRELIPRAAWFGH